MSVDLIAGQLFMEHNEDSVINSITPKRKEDHVRKWAGAKHSHPHIPRSFDALTENSRHAFIETWKGSHISFSECNCKHLLYLKIILGQ